MTCKECVHYDVCKIWCGEANIPMSTDCDYFKNKANFVELSCKVGDKVYVIMETSCEDIDGVYTTCKFYNLKSEDLCTLPKGKCPYRYRIAECYVTEMNLLRFTAEWGKTVFPTREKAEQKLKGGAE